MKVVLQRSRYAQVVVNEEIVGKIDHGLVALVGIAEGDTPETVRSLAEKTSLLRIFADDSGKMNRSVIDVGGGVLAISQFTLLADCRKGRRPALTGAAKPEIAKQLYELYVECLRQKDIHVQCGIFAADMQVSLTNDGPVTIVLDSSELRTS